MKTVYKYEIELMCNQYIEIHGGYRAGFLHVGRDPKGDFSIWCQVDTDLPKEKVRFDVYGTGNFMDETGMYVGTFLDGAFVWHVFTGPIPF